MATHSTAHTKKKVNKIEEAVNQAENETAKESKWQKFRQSAFVSKASEAFKNFGAFMKKDAIQTGRDISAAATKFGAAVKGQAQDIASAWASYREARDVRRENNRIEQYSDYLMKRGFDVASKQPETAQPAAQSTAQPAASQQTSESQSQHTTEPAMSKKERLNYLMESMNKMKAEIESLQNEIEAESKAKQEESESKAEPAAKQTKETEPEAKETAKPETKAVDTQEPSNDSTWSSVDAKTHTFSNKACFSGSATVVVNYMLEGMQKYNDAIGGIRNSELSAEDKAKQAENVSAQFLKFAQNMGKASGNALASEEYRKQLFEKAQEMKSGEQSKKDGSELEGTVNQHEEAYDYDEVKQ